MTREKQIAQAAIDTFGDIPYGFKGQLFEKHIEELRNTFIIGAVWADNHPYVDMFLHTDEKVEDVDLSEND